MILHGKDARELTSHDSQSNLTLVVVAQIRNCRREAQAFLAGGWKRGKNIARQERRGIQLPEVARPVTKRVIVTLCSNRRGFS